MHRGRLNLVLLVVAAGLAAAVWFSQEKKEPGPPLTALKPEAVTQVRLQHPNAPAIRLEKQDGRWKLVEPVQGEADEFEINALVGLADRETQEKVEGASPAELGLDPPQYSLALNDATIEFGAVEPLQYRRYVRAGGVVYLIEDPPSAALDKDYADLVAKAVLPAGADIERIELPRLTLAKDGSGQWTVKPADPKATADAMQKLADGWGKARSMWNEMARDSKVKGDRVRVHLKGGVTREFIVAATDPQLKLHRADLGVNLVLSKALADELLKLPEPPKEPPKDETKKDGEGDAPVGDAAPKADGAK